MERWDQLRYVLWRHVVPSLAAVCMCGVSAAKGCGALRHVSLALVACDVYIVACFADIGGCCAPWACLLLSSPAGRFDME